MEIDLSNISTEVLLKELNKREYKTESYSLKEFKEKLKVGDTLMFDEIVNFDKRTGNKLFWKTITQKNLNEYFSILSDEEYQHHNFKIM